MRHGLLEPAWPKLGQAVGDAKRGADAEAVVALDEEVDLVVDAGAEVYPGYAAYRTRITDREIRVFLLSEA